MAINYSTVYAVVDSNPNTISELQSGRTRLVSYQESGSTSLWQFNSTNSAGSKWELVTSESLWAVNNSGTVNENISYPNKVRIGSGAGSFESLNVDGSAMFYQGGENMALITPIFEGLEFRVEDGVDSNQTPVMTLKDGSDGGTVSASNFVGKLPNIPIETLNTGTSYTIDLSDQGTVLPFNNAAVTITINSNSLVNVGDITYVDYEGTGELTIVEGTGNLLVNPNREAKSDGQYSRIAIQKRNATDYRVFGELKIA